MQLKKGFYNMFSWLIEMARKNFWQVQLTITAIMIAILIGLTQINSSFEILDIAFKIPTSWIWVLSLCFLAPMFVLVITSLFMELEDDTIFIKVAKGCWHLFFLAVGILIFAIIAMILLVYLSKINSFWLSLILVWIIVSWTFGKIKTFFKKKNINIYNPFTWVK